MQASISHPVLKALIIACVSFCFTSPTNSAVLEEIVVTAQKREQSLQDVSVAITAFTPEDIHAFQITRTHDIAARTPGLHGKQSFGDEIPVFTIRGIGLNDFAPVNNPTTSVYVNEVLIPYHTMLGAQIFDIERIEVLKGPQGTLYGRNNTGGAINIITNKPNQDPDASMRVDYGSYDTVEIEAAGGGGITKELAGRAAVLWKNRGKGYQRNRLAGNARHGEIDRIAIRGMLDWTPTEDLNILFSLHGYDRDDDQPHYNHISVLAGPFSFQPFCAAALAGIIDETTCVDFLGYSDLDNDPFVNDADLSLIQDQISHFRGGGGGITINWVFPRFTLTSVTGYERMLRNSEEDTDTSPFIQVHAIFNDSTWAWSEEIRLTSDESWPMDWILGFYYSTDQVDGQITVLGLDATATNVDHDYVQDTDSVAGFAHFGWEFADQFKLNGGIRVTYEKKKMTQLMRDLNPLGISVFTQPASFCGVQGICGIPGLGFDTIPAPGLPPVFGVVPLVDVTGREITETDVSGEIGIDWRPREDLLLYAKFSKGFKSGGFNGGLPFFPQDAEPFNPEDILAWEGGFKTTLLDGAMQLNTAGFYYDYSDFQAVIGRPNGFFPIDNAGDAEVFGFEAELGWAPVEGLQMQFGLAYLDTEVNQSNPLLLQDITGNVLADSPKWTFNGHVSYTHPLPFWDLKFRAQTDFNYTDDFSFEVKNLPILAQESFWRVNARFSVLAPDERWEIAFWARNLADKRYSEERFDFTGFTGIALEQVGFPREIGVSASYRWD